MKKLILNKVRLQAALTSPETLTAAWLVASDVWLGIRVAPRQFGPEVTLCSSGQVASREHLTAISTPNRSWLLLVAQDNNHILQTCSAGPAFLPAVTFYQAFHGWIRVPGLTTFKADRAEHDTVRLPWRGDHTHKHLTYTLHYAATRQIAAMQTRCPGIAACAGPFSKCLLFPRHRAYIIQRRRHRTAIRKPHYSRRLAK